MQRSKRLLVSDAVGLESPDASKAVTRLDGTHAAEGLLRSFDVICCKVCDVERQTFLLELLARAISSRDVRCGRDGDAVERDEQLGENSSGVPARLHQHSALPSKPAKAQPALGPRRPNVHGANTAARAASGSGSANTTAGPATPVPRLGCWTFARPAHMTRQQCPIAQILERSDTRIQESDRMFLGYL